MYSHLTNHTANFHHFTGKVPFRWFNIGLINIIIILSTISATAIAQDLESHNDKTITDCYSDEKIEDLAHRICKFDFKKSDQSENSRTTLYLIQILLIVVLMILIIWSVLSIKKIIKNNETLIERIESFTDNLTKEFEYFNEILNEKSDNSADIVDHTQNYSEQSRCAIERDTMIVKKPITGRGTMIIPEDTEPSANREIDSIIEKLNDNLVEARIFTPSSNKYFDIITEMNKYSRKYCFDLLPVNLNTININRDVDKYECITLYYIKHNRLRKTIRKIARNKKDGELIYVRPHLRETNNSYNIVSKGIYLVGGNLE